MIVGQSLTQHKYAQDRPYLSSTVPNETPSSASKLIGRKYLSIFPTYISINASFFVLLNAHDANYLFVVHEVIK